MIEIKFRAWDGKKMFEPSSVSWKDGVLWVCDSHGENKLEYELIAPNSQLMQYSGLKDKNGKEIYEGDIVKRVYGFTKAKKPQETINEIVYREDWGAFAFYSKHSIGEGWSRMYSGHKVYPFEIIGNIYENPELLK